MNKEFNQKWEGSLTFEKVKRYLPHLPQSQAKFQSKSQTFFHSCKTKKLNSISSFLLDFLPGNWVH